MFQTTKQVEMASSQKNPFNHPNQSIDYQPAVSPAGVNSVELKPDQVRSHHEKWKFATDHTDPENWVKGYSHQPDATYPMTKLLLQTCKS